MSTKPTTPRRSQAGVGLVEVLTALLVMAIGLLGIATLYVQSLRANRTAQLRTHAVNLVSDMADRVRSNRRGQANYVKTAAAAAPAKQGCVVTKVCGANLLARDDLAWWDEAVRAALPPDSTGGAPKTSIAFTPAAAGVLDRYTVRIEWSEPGSTEPLAYQVTFDVLPPT